MSRPPNSCKPEDPPSSATGWHSFSDGYLKKYFYDEYDDGNYLDVNEARPRGKTDRKPD